MQNLKTVFKRLNEERFKLQTDKLELFKKEIEYVGHVVAQKGVKPNPMKIESIKLFPLPKTTIEIKSFVGLIGYYRKFIKDFARVTKLFAKRLKGKQQTVVDEEYIRPFEHCKTLLCNDLLLRYPDFTKPSI